MFDKIFEKEMGMNHQLIFTLCKADIDKSYKEARESEKKRYK